MRAVISFLALLGVDAYPSHSSCPCLYSLGGRLNSNAYLSYSAHTVVVNGGAYQYPLSYGLSTCAAHDAGLAPYCNGGTSPAWCARPWCYVDPTNCRGHSFAKSDYHASYNTDLYFSTQTCASTEPGDAPWNSTGGVSQGHTAAVLKVCSVFSLFDSSLSESGADDSADDQPCGNNPHFATQITEMADALNALNGGKGFEVDAGQPDSPLYFRFSYTLRTYPFGQWAAVGEALSRQLFPYCDFLVGMPNGCPDPEIMLQALIANETKRLYFTGRGPRHVLTAMGLDQPYLFSSHVYARGGQTLD